MKTKPAATATTMRPARPTMPAAARSSSDAGAALDSLAQLAATVAALTTQFRDLHADVQALRLTRPSPADGTIPLDQSALAVRIARAETDIRDLRAAISAVQARPSPLPDAAWLAVIADATGDAVFNAADLRQHARIHRRLRQALTGMTTERIGKRLARLSRSPVGPFVIERIGRDEDGAIWRLTMRDRQADAGLRSDRGL